jgi:hypothetical protein
MLRHAMTGLFALLCSFAIHASASAATIDLSKPVPATLELTEGDSVVFENGFASFTVKETDGKGKLLDPRPHNTFNQAGAFRAARVGTGEIVLTFPSKGQLTVIRKETIAVIVKAAPVVHKVEFKAFQNAISINQGESIVLFVAFKGDPGLYDPMRYPLAAKTTDGKAGDVFDTISGVKRLDKDNIQIIRYDAKRAGDAEIVVQDVRGKEVAKIKVTVK